MTKGDPEDAKRRSACNIKLNPLSVKKVAAATLHGKRTVCIDIVTPSESYNELGKSVELAMKRYK